jgi:hypothetical protein
MRTIQLHPTSLLVGAAVVGLAFLTMAQNPQPINPTWSPRNPQPVVLLRDYVQIREGTPYTVPPNKILMITAIGREDAGLQNVFLLINGTVRLSTSSGSYSWGPSAPHVHEVAKGLTANAGDVITVDDFSMQGGLAVAWGYLADA